jgi:CRP-like cAMP-binding protein
MWGIAAGARRDETSLSGRGYRAAESSAFAIGSDMGWTKPTRNQPRNLLLRAMRSAISSDIVIGAQPIALERGTVLSEPGGPMRYVYFPLSCVLSSVSGLRDGTMMATTLRGYEGAFGLLTAIRRAKAHTKCQVQIEGSALRLDAKQLVHLFDVSAQIRQLFLSYWDAVMFQYEQTAVCNTRHTISARLSRCLLDIHDRVIGDVIPFTHQNMANLIAANRTTVSLAASSLRRSGVIETDRGNVRIVDQKGLQAASCECYASVRSRYEMALK